MLMYQKRDLEYKVDLYPWDIDRFVETLVNTRIIRNENDCFVDQWVASSVEFRAINESKARAVEKIMRGFKSSK